jgi:protein-disulfide isomerase
MGDNCCSTFSKVAVTVSVVALVVAVASYFCPKRPCGGDQTCGGNIREAVVNVIRNNPQMVMDAMGEGMAKKREDVIKQLAKDVAMNKEVLSQMSITFGDRAAKSVFIAFIDPLCKHCIEFQKDAVKALKAKKNVCFHLLPVAVIGEDSITLAKIYYVIYAKSPEKALAFIEYVTNSTEAMDKDGIEKALKSVGLSSKDIESAMPDGDKKVIASGKKAEELKVPFIPAVFHVTGNEAEVVKSPNLDSILRAADGGSPNIDSGSPEESRYSQPNKNRKK